MPGMTPYKAPGFFFSPMSVLHIDRADRVLRFYPVDLLGIPASALFFGRSEKELRVCGFNIERLLLILGCSRGKGRSQSDCGLGFEGVGKEVIGLRSRASQYYDGV
jgi:hypothetical protein